MCPYTALAVTMPLTATHKPLSNQEIILHWRNLIIIIDRMDRRKPVLSGECGHEKVLYDSLTSTVGE